MYAIRSHMHAGQRALPREHRFESTRRVKRGWRINHAVGARQLAAKACVDQAERFVVATAIRSEGAFVAFADNDEAAGLAIVYRSLELSRAERREHETAGRDWVTIELDVSYGVQRAVVAKADAIDLPRTGKNVPRFELAYTSIVVRNDADREISVAHPRLQA